MSVDVNNSISFEEMIERYWAFAEKTFDTLPWQATFGLVREAKELNECANAHLTFEEGSTELELEEASDVMFYLIYFLKKSGFTMSQFIEAMDSKLEVLKKRKWKKDETGCYSHVKKSPIDFECNNDGRMNNDSTYG